MAIIILIMIIIIVIINNNNNNIIYIYMMCVCARVCVCVHVCVCTCLFLCSWKYAHRMFFQIFSLQQYCWYKLKIIENSWEPWKSYTPTHQNLTNWNVRNKQQILANQIICTGFTHLYNLRTGERKPGVTRDARGLFRARRENGFERSLKPIWSLLNWGWVFTMLVCILMTVWGLKCTRNLGWTWGKFMAYLKRTWYNLAPSWVRISKERPFRRRFLTRSVERLPTRSSLCSFFP